ncbi:MAG: M14 family metallopeptidase, partial [Bryobacteraceae bacterium]
AIVVLSNMLRRAISVAFNLVLCSAAAAVPTPGEHFGYEPGTDYKLADYGEITGYFEKLAASSDRIKFVEYGKTSLGKPSYIAFISSPENLRNLEQHRSVSRRLTLGQASSEEARRLARQGKVIVWIDSGLHSSEVAPAQHSSLLAYRMLSGESDEIRRIRSNVFLMQVPVINPDGLDMVVHWYRKNLGTPYELAPLPGLYQKYAGHDNNRDWFMMNLQETRNASRLLFQEWFPQIVYNQHQAPPFPARIFVPPYAEPLNPNIPAPVMEGINLIGAAMKERFAREEKPGVISYLNYDAWWNGGLRSAPAFHNMHGILTETALFAFATPHVYAPADLPERFDSGIPTKEPTVFYQRPWLGGKWGLRDAIDYMLTADMAILDTAAGRSEHFLLKAWELATHNIELGKKGKPFAYVIAEKQWDRSVASEMLRRLQLGGVEVSRASAPISAAGKTYPEGTYFIPAAQAFRGYLIDLLEPQRYPELRAGTSGPVKPPYDIAGWTLSMQMNVAVDRVDEVFTVKSEAANTLPAAPSFSANPSISKALRVGLYEPWTANIDTGWTQYVLDTFGVAHTVLHNEDFAKSDLRSRQDVIIVASQPMASILHGHKLHEPGRRRAGSGDTGALQRPEYTGGIALGGAASLQTFVRDGGTLITFDEAGDLPIQLFPLPVRNVLVRAPGETSATAYFCPGSILRINMDSSHPVSSGVPANAYAFQIGGQAYEVTLAPEYNKGDRAVKTIARYAAKNVLASGWLTGEHAIAGRAAVVEAPYGKGRVVLFGFRPQFRGQTYGTIKLLLNAINLAAQ